MSSLPLRVIKFGGSSVGNAEAMRRSAEIILASHRGGYGTACVLSAVFGVTNRLLSCVKHAEKGDRGLLKRSRDELLDGHARIARSLCPPSAAGRVMDYVQGTLSLCVDDVCRDILGAGKASAEQRDLASSVGEKWSTRLMAEYMGSGAGGGGGGGAAGGSLPPVHFVDAADVIVTDGVFGDSRVLLDLTQRECDAHLRPLVAGGGIPLVTGFYGSGVPSVSPGAADTSRSSASGSSGSGSSSSSGGRRLTTLGRGGSDLSAATLGYALDAAEIVLYKVEYNIREEEEAAAVGLGVGGGKGWMDSWAPGWVGIAHCANPDTTIPTIHYEEARELAHFAKAVLHPDTVSPAVARGIPINVRNSLDPHHPGTIIQGSGSSTSGSSGAGSGSGSGSSSSRGGTTLPSPRITTVTRTELSDYEVKQSALAHSFPPSWSPRERAEAFLVALVGIDVMRVPGVEARAVKALSRAGIKYFLPPTLSGSNNNFTVVVPNEENTRTLELFHRVFVLGEQQ